jgi:hypothetical protein
MKLRLLAPVGLLFALAACADDQTPCAVEPAVGIVDTLLGATIAGERWAVAVDSFYQWHDLDTTLNRVTVGATSWDLAGRYTTLTFSIADFHGAGDYPIPAGQQGLPGTAYGSFSCNGGSFYALGGPGEQVTVVAWDSVTHEISGSFAWRGYRPSGGYEGPMTMPVPDLVEPVEDGTFHTTLTPQ